jgi:hypothetical protein
MFKYISWSDYLTTIALIATIYYVVIIIRFYLPDLKRITTSNIKNRWARLSPAPISGQIQNNQKATITTSTSQKLEEETDQELDDFDKIRHVCDQLSLTIGQCASDSIVKEDFSCKISGILQKYPPIKYSPYYHSINELIVSECGKHHYNLLSDDELKNLWTN